MGWGGGGRREWWERVGRVGERWEGGGDRKEWRERGKERKAETDRGRGEGLGGSERDGDWWGGGGGGGGA